MEISLLLSAAKTVSSNMNSDELHPVYQSSTNHSGGSHSIERRQTHLPRHDGSSRSHGIEGQPLSLPPFSRLNASLQSEDVKKAKPYKCTVDGCDATFGQKGSLTRHVKSRHEKLRPHTCEQCQKSFSALWTLRVHQRNVHLKAKPHKCHLCNKSFGELFNKSKHIAIVHDGKRPFSCPICSRSFGYKGDMRKHVLELHEQSGRPYQCIIPTCGVKFAKRRYLKRHENLSHKGHPLLVNRDRELQAAAASSSKASVPSANHRRHHGGS